MYEIAKLSPLARVYAFLIALVEEAEKTAAVTEFPRPTTTADEHQVTEITQPAEYAMAELAMQEGG